MPDAGPPAPRNPRHKPWAGPLIGEEDIREIVRSPSALVLKFSTELLKTLWKNSPAVLERLSRNSLLRFAHSFSSVVGFTLCY